MDRRLSRLEEIATIFEASLKSEEIDINATRFLCRFEIKM